MNILFAMPWDQDVGGVTEVVTSVAAGLEHRGHHAVFLFPRDGSWKLRPGATRRGFRAVTGRLRRYAPSHANFRARLSWYSAKWVTLPQLIRYARAHHIDLINVHFPDSQLALLADLADRLPVPLVVSVHGSDLLEDDGAARDPGLVRLLTEAWAVVAPSDGYLRTAVDAYPVLAGKTQRIYNGFDPGNVPGDVLARAPATGVRVLCVAGLSWAKGVDVLIRALALCAESRPELRLIGNGPARDELTKLADTLGVGARMTFLGAAGRGTVFDELRAADYVVLPSRKEAFGLAALEAMACGRAVIASRVGGLSEVIADGETGLLVPPDDPPALARAMDRLAADADLRRRLGNAGRDRAKGFGVAAMIDAYETLFARLVNGGP